MRPDLVAEIHVADRAGAEHRHGWRRGVGRLDVVKVLACRTRPFFSPLLLWVSRACLGKQLF
jgi:hypothetical protein